MTMKLYRQISYFLVRNNNTFRRRCHVSGIEKNKLGGKGTTGREISASFYSHASWDGDACAIKRSIERGIMVNGRTYFGVPQTNVEREGPLQADTAASPELKPQYSRIKQ